MADSFPKRRLSRDESQKLTRERLIEAGRRLFIANGYGGTSLRDIAAEAGYSQGAFYSNFASKEELLLELLREHMALKMAQLEDLFTTTEEAVDLMAAIENWAATLNDYYEWSILAVELRLHATRNAEFAAVYEPLEARHRRDLARLLASLYTRSGKQAPHNTEILSEALIACADGMALNREGGRVPPLSAAMMALLTSLLATAPNL